MIVREAVLEDLPATVELLIKFHAESAYYESIPINRDTLVTSVTHFITNPLIRVFLAELDDGTPVGGTAGMLYPWWFNEDYITGQELFWFVEPEHRRSKAGKLLFQALEDWATEQGAKTFAMAAVHNKHYKRVEQVYQAKGYIPTETGFIKEL